MKRTHILSFLFALAVLVAAGLSSLGQTSAPKLSVRHASYEFDLETKKIIGPKGEGSVTSDMIRLPQIEIKLLSPGDLVTAGVSSGDIFSRSLRDKLDEYIDRKVGADMERARYETRTVEKRWRILVRPILNDDDGLKDLIFAIERQRRLTTGSDPGSVFEVKEYVLSEKELRMSKEFSYTSAGIRLDELIKDEGRIKILINETPAKIQYETFEVSMVEPVEVTAIAPPGRLDELSPRAAGSVIEAPFIYDVKYENSEGMEQTIEGVHQAEQFFFKIRTTDLINAYTLERMTVQYNLKCKIFPVKYESAKLEVELVLSGDEDTYSSQGEKVLVSSSKYSKTIVFEPGDVVEVKLPDNWPYGKSGQPYDPKTLRKDSKYTYQSGIEKQSLFIRPVRLKEKSTTK